MRNHPEQVTLIKRLKHALAEAYADGLSAREASQTDLNTPYELAAWLVEHFRKFPVETKTKTKHTMKRIILTLSLLFALLAIPKSQAAETPKVAPEIKSSAWLADVSLEPYGTVSWLGLNGKAVTGAGANFVTHISKSFSLWTALESDNTQHSTVDRGAAGIRAEGWIGKRARFDAGAGLGYDFEGDSVFLRLPFGATAFLIQSKEFDFGARIAYAFDIRGGHNRGTADGRAFAGLVGTWKL